MRVYCINFYAVTFCIQDSHIPTLLHSFYSEALICVLPHAGNLSKLKDDPIVVKEGSEYKLEVVFRVQREIVAGLRYFQTTYRKGIRGM